MSLKISDIKPEFIALIKDAMAINNVFIRPNYFPLIESVNLKLQNKTEQEQDQYFTDILTSIKIIKDHTRGYFNKVKNATAITDKLEIKITLFSLLQILNNNDPLFSLFNDVIKSNLGDKEKVKIFKDLLISLKNVSNINETEIDDFLDNTIDVYKKNLTDAEKLPQSMFHRDTDENESINLEVNRGAATMNNNSEQQIAESFNRQTQNEIEQQAKDIHETMKEYIDFLSRINEIEINDPFLKQQIDTSTKKLIELKFSITQHLANEDAHLNSEDIITINWQSGNKDPLKQIPESLLALASKIIDEANLLQNIVNSYQSTIFLKQENAALTEKNAILANQNEALIQKLEAFSKKNVYFADVLYAKLTQLVDFIKSIASKIFGTTTKTSAENTKTTIQQPSEIKAEESKPKGMPVQKVTLNWSNFKETIKESTETMDRLHNIINEFKNKSPEI